MIRLGVTAPLLMGLWICGGTPAFDVSGYPPEMQENYEIFDLRCSRCHDLERAMNAQVKPGEWGKFVARMARHPASGVGAQDEVAITAFLEFHHGPAAAKGGSK